VYLLPLSQTILSVSGSAAMKSTFFCFAKSATASPTFEANVPMMKWTFSRVTSSSAMRTASPGLPLSSRETTSSLRPNTPPAAFTSSTASSQPLR